MSALLQRLRQGASTSGQLHAWSAWRGLSTNGHGGEAEARVHRLAFALAQTNLAPLLTREGKITIKTQAPVQKGEKLLVFALFPVFCATPPPSCPIEARQLPALRCRR